MPKSWYGDARRRRGGRTVCYEAVKVNATRSRSTHSRHHTVKASPNLYIAGRSVFKDHEMLLYNQLVAWNLADLHH